MLRGIHPTKKWTGCIGPMPSRLGDTPFPVVPAPLRCPVASSQARPQPPDVAQPSAQLCPPAHVAEAQPLADDHFAFELGPNEPCLEGPPEWDNPDDAAFFGCFDPL